MPIDTIVLLLGIASSATLVLSALSTHKPRLLIFGMITSVIVMCQFTLTGAYVGLVASAIGILRSSTVLASMKWAWLNHWIMIPVFIVAQVTGFALINDWAHVQWYNFIPVIGAIAGVTALFFSNLIYTKSIYIGAGLIWLMYEYSVGAYGHMVGETLNIISTIIALVFLVRAAKTGTQVEEPTTELIHVITTSIPVITSRIPVVNTLTKSVPTQN